MGAMLGDCSPANGYVLYGHPHSLVQAEALEEVASAFGCGVTESLYLDVSDDEIVRRLSGWLICPAWGRTGHETSKPPPQPGVCDACGGELFRRTDDEPVTIRQRITVFHRMIDPLRDFYRATGRLMKIAAGCPVQAPE
jgi:adenylate kinase